MDCQGQSSPGLFLLIGHADRVTFIFAVAKLFPGDAIVLFRCHGSSFSSTIKTVEVDVVQFNAVQVHHVAPFAITVVFGCFAEAEIQSVNPPVSTVAGKTSVLTGTDLEQDPAHKEGPSC